MSLKPPKKSDLDKSWMKARQDRPKKIQPEYHLIVTEGTETEPAYFGAIRDIINSSYPDKIQLNIHGIGNNTLTLFQKAKQLSDASANGYRHVWIVYDTDDFPAEHINKTAQLCVSETSVYKGYKQDKIEMRGDRAEMSDFPLYLNMVAGGLDRRDQTISGFSFVVKIYAVPVVEIIG